MSTGLVIIQIILIIAGIAGCFLPVLPGPPLVWLGLLIMKLCGVEAVTTQFLIVTAVITLLLELLEYFLPVWFAKISGGTKYGIRGATVGLIAGFFFPPLGFILGPAAGALIGELLHNSKDINKAIKAALFSLLGFVISTGLGLAWCLYLAYSIFKLGDIHIF